MSEPSSFCSISTFGCHHELFGLMLSLSLHHPGAKFYAMVDTKTMEHIKSYNPTINLDIRWFVELDKYTDLNRKIMEKRGIFKEFVSNKIKLVNKILDVESDTLFLDADILVLDRINNIDHSKTLGLSPHYIKKKDTDKFGFYNVGVLWTNNKKICESWTKHIKTSRFYEQTPLEDLAKEFSYFEFGENYNFSWWRITQSDDSMHKIIQNVEIIDNKIHYKHNPLKFVHTHFHQHIEKPNMAEGLDAFALHTFNKLIKDSLEKIKDYRSLLIINRMINHKWVIHYPNQPMSGIWGHSNDSYRQLLVLIKYYNTDVEIRMSSVKNIWLGDKVLLYDRPTLKWFDESCQRAFKVLLGNGSMDKEGTFLHNKGLDVSPWIFWPRKPILLEKILKKGILLYTERKYESIFIGNYENNIQKNYRKTQDWATPIEEFHCTAGGVHKFTPEEYLMKIRQSKYGLCLRGYGSKCHREVELMSMGTIPIITSDVSIKDYANPPLENVHYIKVHSPGDISKKISSISKEEWEVMSRYCHEWYMNNVHGSTTWNTTLKILFYN